MTELPESEHPGRYRLLLRLVLILLVGAILAAAGKGAFDHITGRRFPFYAPEGITDGVTRILEDPSPYTQEELEAVMDQVEAGFAAKYRACTLLRLWYDPAVSTQGHDLALQATIYSGRYASKEMGITAPSSQFLWTWYFDRSEDGSWVLAAETAEHIPDATL